MIKQPDRCPNCYDNTKITYERFSRTKGKYVCHICEWSQDAETGEIIDKGQYYDGNEFLKKALEIAIKDIIKMFPYKLTNNMKQRLKKNIFKLAEKEYKKEN